MKAVTIGSATIDIIADIADEDIERMTLHNSTSSFLLLEPGKKIDAEGISTYTGGGAVNAAVSLSRQGYDVSALVKVGKDLNADKLRERLEEENVAVDLVCEHATELTAVSVLISSHDNNAAIFTHRGANGYVTDADVSAQKFAGADLVYVTNLSNASADRFPDVVARAKKAGAFVVSNPGIRQLTNRTGPFFDSLKDIDLFLCNYHEARALIPQLVDRTGWEPHHRELEATDYPMLSIEGFQITLEDYMSRVHNLGPRYVGVTNGGNGAWVSDGNSIHLQPVVPAVVKGTTGAGDSFASTLAGSLARGFELAKSCRLAAINAASVVSEIDAQSGLRTIDVLLDALDS